MPLCVVTDLGAGIRKGTGVTQEEVMAVLARTAERLRDVLTATFASLAAEPACDCRSLRPSPLRL